MKRADLIIATGGRPMVKSAYSAGVPAYGSGAGNATVIIDDTCLTHRSVREKLQSKHTYFQELPTSVPAAPVTETWLSTSPSMSDFVKALEAEGAYLANEEEAEMLKKVMWDETGHRLPQTVAISPRETGSHSRL